MKATNGIEMVLNKNEDSSNPTSAQPFKEGLRKHSGFLYEIDGTFTKRKITENMHALQNN